MTEETNPQLEKIQTEVQNFVNGLSNKPRYVQDVLMVFETVRYDDRGEAIREIEYSIVTRTTSLAAANGLADIAHIYIQRDLNGFRWPEDDND